MTRAPEMFSVWVTKQVSGFCGSNHMMNHIYGDVVDRCPNCGDSPEKANHMLHCRSSDRVAVFTSSVMKLSEWLHKQQTDFELNLLIKDYLLARGDRTLLSFCGPNSIYRQLAHHHDQLGYDNFLEGRISKLFCSMRQLDISRRGLRKNAGHWCNGLVLHLLQITHRQWTYRCQTVNNSTRSCGNVKTSSGQILPFSFRKTDIFYRSISRNLGVVLRSCDSSGFLKWKQQPMPLAFMMQDKSRSYGKTLNSTHL
jgi:hypothetical protein